MQGIVSFVRVALVAMLFAAILPAPAAAQGGRSISYADVAAQLGVVIQGDGSREFDLGSQFTGTLKEPAKLEAMGIAGMQAGARVVAVRTSPDRIRVEADQLDVEPSRGAVTLRVGAQGKLVVAGRGS